MAASAQGGSSADKSVGPAGKKADALRNAGGDSLPPVPSNRYVAFFSIAALGLAADLITKQILFAWLGIPDGKHNNCYWIVENYFGFETAVNRGALFGMGEGYWWLFSILSVVAAIGIVTWLFFYRAAHDKWLTIALACVMAGIFGNLYDRIGLWDSTGLPAAFDHGVRDWILFRWREVKYTWPNFNIADCLLVCGAAMLVLHAWFGPQAAEPAKIKNAQAATA